MSTVICKILFLLLFDLVFMFNLSLFLYEAIVINILTPGMLFFQVRAPFPVGLITSPCRL